jgi:hypothetical protein
MATLAKLLQVDMSLPDMAKRLAAAGRGKDSILAHINPKEMALLKKHGGSGKTNPRTGIMEFANEDDTSGDLEPVAEAPAPTTQNVPTVQAGSPPAEAAPAAPDRAPYDARKPFASYAGSSASGAGQPPVAETAPAEAPPAATPAQTTSTVTGENLGASQRDYPSASLAATQPPAEEEKPSYAKQFANFISPVTQGAETLTKALDPLTPYAKFGTQALGIYQANKAANETREQSARNEAEIRALADPYRKQAQLMQEQGQKMLAAGQSGQLTPQQQQDLETRRAVALQQQAAAGVSGGTAQQQVEADIQRTAQQYAQQNINQGLALMSQAQSVTGAADSLIQQAIKAGYSGSQDANKLASEFYNAIGFSLPQTQSKGPTTAGETNG